MKGMIAGLDERLDRMGEKLEKKEFKIPVDLTGGIIFLLFSIVVLFMIPKQVTISDKDVVNGRLFPTLLMIVMMICCVALIVKELYKIKKKLPLTYKAVNALVEVKALIIMTILILTYVISRVTNQFLIGAIFCSLGFLLYFRCKIWKYYVITVGMACIIWAAFRYGLKVNF